MQQIIINLKQRIDKNNKKILKKCLLTKPILEMINQLIDNKASKEEIQEWLEKYDDTLYTIKHHLNLIEEQNYDEK